MSAFSVSIVIPCLNEEKNIRQAVVSSLEALDRFSYDGEIIIVNDGSSDGTRAAAEELVRLEGRVRLLNHEVPRGIGASFWDGAMQASKEYVTLIPGDNENDAAQILAYAPLTEQVDIVVPFIHNLEIRSWFRRILSSFYRLILNLTFGMNLNYTNGTVMYRTSLLRNTRLDSTGFFYQAELLVRLIRQGYLYAEVPNFLRARSSGKTKAISFRSLRAVTGGYLRLAWNVHVLRNAGRRDPSLLCKDSVTYEKIILAAGEQKA